MNKLRFAPSPTGYLHIGGLRTALYNYLYARHTDGAFILRIEDTDRTRYVEGALENLLEVLEWAGLEHDEGPFLKDGEIVQKGPNGPYIQSERQEAGIYDQAIGQLLAQDDAYYCFCSQERIDRLREEQKARGETPRYDGKCRHLTKEEVQEKLAAGQPHVIRHKLPENQDVSFHDELKGKITINTSEMDDQVLIKSDGFPTYHFAVVVDDHDMEITHIVRGEEWVTSTPKHVLLYQAFGWDLPKFVHLPTVLGKDHKKLSKRTGDVAVEQFIEQGYLQEALINYIALVGWSPKGNEEILSMDQLIDQFSFKGVSNSGGIFDRQKLDWVNGQYIRELSVEDLAPMMAQELVKAGMIEEDYDQERMLVLAETFQKYLDRLDQTPELVNYLFVDADQLEYEEEAVEALSSETGQTVLRSLLDILQGLDQMDLETANAIPKQVQKETGIKGKDLWFALRAATTGQGSGPSFGNIIFLLGLDESIKRTQAALDKFPSA